MGNVLTKRWPRYATSAARPTCWRRDVADLQAVDRLAAHALKYGRVDIHINAAQSGDATTEDMSPEDWRRVIDDNLSACNGGAAHSVV